MIDGSNTTPGDLIGGGHIARLIDVNQELLRLSSYPYTHPTPERIRRRLKLKHEQIGLITLLGPVHGMRGLSRLVGKYETWAKTALRDWHRRLARIETEQDAATR